MQPIDRETINTGFYLEIENYRSYATPSRSGIWLKPGMTGFVGPNNAGKSNFMKLFFELRALFNSLGHDIVKGAIGTTAFVLPQHRDPETIFNANNGDGILIRVHAPPALRAPRNPAIATPAVLTLAIPRPTLNAEIRLQYADRSIGLAEIKQTTMGLVRSDSIRGVEFDLSAYQTIFKLLASTLYIGPFRNIVNTGALADYFDLVIGDAFVSQWSDAQAGGRVANSRAVTAVISDIERLFGFQRLEVYASSDRKTLQLNVDGEPFQLEDLGSGLSQFIAVLFSAAIKRPEIILIDEPELNLHPSLQLDFLTTLSQRAGFGTIFATHSLGLARVAADQLYVVRKSEGRSKVDEFEMVPNPTEFLGELSYSGNYSMGTRKILLVEGPTEIKVLARLLRKIRSEHEFTMVSMGGSSMINKKASRALFELLRISRDVYAIVDSERTSTAQRAKPDRLQFERICRRAGIECLVLEGRSIESYFSDAAIKRVIGTSFQALQLDEAVPANWPKSMNWKIADRMDFEDLRYDDLKDFLRRIAAEPLKT